MNSYSQQNEDLFKQSKRLCKICYDIKDLSEYKTNFAPPNPEYRFYCHECFEYKLQNTKNEAQGIQPKIPEVSRQMYQTSVQTVHPIGICLEVYRTQLMCFLCLNLQASCKHTQNLPQTISQKFSHNLFAPQNEQQ